MTKKCNLQKGFPTQPPTPCCFKFTEITIRYFILLFYYFIIFINIIFYLFIYLFFGGEGG